jgi:hypothetical protein
MKSTLWLLLAIVVVLVTSCQTATPSPTPVPVLPTPTQVMPTPYPPPDSNSVEVNNPYPEPRPTIGLESYPSPQNSGGPQSTTPGSVSWDDAQNMILNGQVDQIVQHHDLTVTLTLKDGKVVTTTEPEFDDVIHLIEQCGEKCSSIAVTTE